MSVTFLPLSQGDVATVDAEDFDRLNAFKWTLKKTRSHKYAYRQHMLAGKLVQVLLHREVVKCPDGLVVDHINRNGLDNRKENLRVCTQSENIANSLGHSDRKYALPKGIEYKVGRKANPYSARITKNGVRHFLGNFASVEEAVGVRNTKAQELFGTFARC